MRQIVFKISLLLLACLLIFSIHHFRISEDTGLMIDERQRQQRLRLLMQNDPSDKLQVSNIEGNSSRLLFTLNVNSHNDFLMDSITEIGELARYVDGQWVPMPYIEKPTIILDVGEIILSGTTSTYKVNFNYLFGTLPYGKYIYIRRFTPLDASSDSANINPQHEFIFVEFEI